MFCSASSVHPPHATQPRCIMLCYVLLLLLVLSRFRQVDSNQSIFQARVLEWVAMYVLYIMLLIAYIYIHIYMYIYNSRGLWKNKGS